MKSPPLLEVSGLSKSFPGVRALQNVDLELQKGEVLALVGENGAGKSTLMKILAGIETADAGRISIEGKPIQFPSPLAAIEAGVVLIHQELNLCQNLDIAQNIFLGREPRFLKWLVDNRKIYRKSKSFLQQVQLKMNPRTKVSHLSVGQQQLVEIAKALSVEAKIIIFDEPTASLSTAESEALFQLIDRLKEMGVGIIYISHRLAEIERLASRVIVLRDGQRVTELQGIEIQQQKMVVAMVGRDLSGHIIRSAASQGPVVLQVDQLTTLPWPKQKITFELRAGEVLGIAGLVGSGRTELLQTLFGIFPPISGDVKMDGKKVAIRSPQQAVQRGLMYVPEDRKEQGIVLDLNIRHNLGLAKLKRNQRWGGWLNSRRLKLESRMMIEQLKIKTPHDLQLCRYLSGGNQQKVVLGKWLLMSPKILLLDEPTRGIDIGAKREIYQLIDRLATEQMGILMVSSELDEIIGMSDRVLVMREGKLAGQLNRDELSEESIMRLATCENE